ncbi:hypothetical protein M8818_007586 [Zalaria obscura]|uniref:Uncharacterized protein n=1 Tax=Zalaria obscura TaxID=2024903 RepID=A0ACC3S3L2_9PEZI
MLMNQSLHEDLNLIYDGDGSSDIGPAAGLLAAYDADPEAHWLVLACDYPHITASDLGALLEAYEAPVTCFVNEEGFHEPLVALWSPEALRKLRQNVSNGINGPARTIKMLNGKRMRPEREMALFNANTPQEWETALQMARSLGNVQPKTV